MSGYTSREVAKLLGLSVGRLRGFVRSGFLSPERGSRGELRFSFPDLVLLRAAKELVESRVPQRRVRAALRQLRAELPKGRPLSALSISAEGGRVVVRDGRRRWNPESGQQLFSFDVAEIAERVAPLAERNARRARDAAPRLGAEEWFELGCELEASSPGEARDAYRRAVDLDPDHADAHTNLGRQLHEAGDLEAAEAHYRRALAARADDPTALFNLAVVLEDRGRAEEAMAVYQRLLAADPRYADAHYNLGRLYERMGREVAAVRHLRIYRRLLKGR
ncbi:MAG: tetratricopeptide repeat protein [Deltaproteobacteria bacterium]|nr:tetratricopeptide repeat protein [Deltaproteobacteria bacterium]